MKQLIFLSLSTVLLIGFSGCDKFSFKKKTVEYREKIQGYYTARIVESTFSSFPDPPSGVNSDVVREIKVEKGVADSTIIVDGVTYKLPADQIYDKIENAVSGPSYNFVHLEFFARNGNDSLTYTKSSGDPALYRTTVINAAYNRGL